MEREAKSGGSSVSTFCLEKLTSFVCYLALQLSSVWRSFSLEDAPFKGLSTIHYANNKSPLDWSDMAIELAIQDKAKVRASTLVPLLAFDCSHHCRQYQLPTRDPDLANNVSSGVGLTHRMLAKGTYFRSEDNKLG